MHYSATARISAARQCNRLAARVGREWAQYTVWDITRDLAGCAPHRVPEAIARAEREGFDDSTAAILGVPDRWAPRFNAVVEREYRAALLRLAPWAFDGPEE